MNVLRNAAERIARRVVFTRCLPSGFGPGRISVSPDAMLGIVNWNIADTDPTLFAAARRHVKAGMRVWDIGANLGLFGFAAAWMAGSQGRVLLVEADPWLCSLLQRSARGLAGKGYADVVVASCAVTDHAGPVGFEIAARNRASTDPASK
jgi:predicted RNA methylase